MIKNTLAYSCTLFIQYFWSVASRSSSNPCPNYLNRIGVIISDENIPVFKQPRNKKKNFCGDWKQSLMQNQLFPKTLFYATNTSWPAFYPLCPEKARLDPENPLQFGLVFLRVECVYTSDAPPRKTLKSSFVIRGAQPDEMNEFQEQDPMNYSDIVKRVILNRHEFRSPAVAYKYET